MNTNTPHNTTTTSGTQGSNFGNKIRGAVDVVHGAGENIRGTILGAVDTIGHRGPTQNDEIAQQGRLEMERGLGFLRGSNPRAPDGQTYATQTNAPPLSHPSTTTGTTGESQVNHPIPQGNTTTSYGAVRGPTAPNAARNPPTGNDQRHGLGLDDQNTTRGTGGETSYPSHHREDAISSVPPAQLHDIQALDNHPGQTQNMGSEYDPSQAQYRNQFTGHTADNTSKAPVNNPSGEGFGTGTGNTQPTHPTGTGYGPVY